MNKDRFPSGLKSKIEKFCKFFIIAFSDHFKLSEKSVILYFYSVYFIYINIQDILFYTSIILISILADVCNGLFTSSDQLVRLINIFCHTNKLST